MKSFSCEYPVTSKMRSWPDDDESMAKVVIFAMVIVMMVLTIQFNSIQFK